MKLDTNENESWKTVDKKYVEVFLHGFQGVDYCAALPIASVVQEVYSTDAKSPHNSSLDVERRGVRWGGGCWRGVLRVRGRGGRLI